MAIYNESKWIHNVILRRLDSFDGDQKTSDDNNKIKITIQFQLDYDQIVVDGYCFTIANLQLS